MITLVVPTRNRAHTLRLVAPTYFSQELVSQIIFVNDAGDDNTPDVISEISPLYPATKYAIINNKTRLGASQSRNIGVAHASNSYILFCDDDEYMESGYAKTCFGKLNYFGAAAISGRRIYMKTGETREGALHRFGNGRRGNRLFLPLICETINSATFTGDKKVPFTNANILTRKELVEKYPFDYYYAKGNGYREETDYQMNLFVNGLDIYITNDTHTFHLAMSQVRTGGQRVQVLPRVYWSLYYTNYFYGKYYDRYAARMGLRVPRSLALLSFAVFAVSREVVRAAMWGRSIILQNTSP